MQLTSFRSVRLRLFRPPRVILARTVISGVTEMPCTTIDRGEAVRFQQPPEEVVTFEDEDRTDDGGDLRRADNPNGRDEGFRLWDVKERRKPAPPKPKDDP